MPGLGVVVCTGRSSVAQRVRGLRLGADDWITKPCHPEEVIARVESVVRRRKHAAGRVDDGPVTAGDLEIRADQFQAFAGGRSVDLTRREFEVLQLLAARRGQGAPARGDLPARVGLRDGPRRPLGRRLHPQGAPEARGSVAASGATSTLTSGSATGSTRRRMGPRSVRPRGRGGARRRGGVSDASPAAGAAPRSRQSGGSSPRSSSRARACPSDGGRVGPCASDATTLTSPSSISSERGILGVVRRAPR